MQTLEIPSEVARNLSINVAALYGYLLWNRYDDRVALVKYTNAASELNLSLPTITTYMKVLQDHGLVEVRFRGSNGNEVRFLDHPWVQDFEAHPYERWQTPWDAGGRPVGKAETLQYSLGKVDSPADYVRWIIARCIDAAYRGRPFDPYNYEPVQIELSTIANMVGVSIRSIVPPLRILEECGVLEVTERTGDCANFRIRFDWEPEAE